MNKLQSSFPNISYRMWQNDHDYQIFADLQNQYNQKLGIDRRYNVADLKSGLVMHENYRPETMFYVAEAEGLPICIQTFTQDKETNGPHLFFHKIAVHPQWVAHPFISELFDIVEQHYTAIAQTLDPAFAVHASCGYEEKEEWRKQMLSEKGHAPIRYFFQMKRPAEMPIDLKPLPDGLQIKPVDTKEKEFKVIYASDEAFKDHWGHTPLTEKMIQAWMENTDYNPSLWKVAWDGDQVAGSVLNFINEQENQALQRKRGYTEEITTTRAYRGKGVASALIAASIQMFQKMGMEEVALSVDTINPSGALGLYQSFGYEPYKQKVAVEKKIR